jgi:hypothetical protein
LCANNQAGYSRAVVVDLGKPLLSNVFKGCRGCDREANEEDIGLGI